MSFLILLRCCCNAEEHKLKHTFERERERERERAIHIRIPVRIPIRIRTVCGLQMHGEFALSLSQAQ